MKIQVHAQIELSTGKKNTNTRIKTSSNTRTDKAKYMFTIDYNRGPIWLLKISSIP